MNFDLVSLLFGAVLYGLIVYVVKLSGNLGPRYAPVADPNRPPRPWECAPCRVRIPGELMWGTVVFHVVRLDNTPGDDEYPVQVNDEFQALPSGFVDNDGVPIYELDKGGRWENNDD